MIDGTIQFRVKRVKRRFGISYIKVTMELVVSDDVFVLDTLSRWAVRRGSRHALGDILQTLWIVATDKFKALKLLRDIKDGQLKRWAELRIVGFGDIEKLKVFKE